MKESLLKQIRKIPEIKQLNFECDEKEFIDPYRINPSNGTWAEKAKIKITKYFDVFFRAVEENDISTVRNLGKHLHEINATRLGYSRPGKYPVGKGFSATDLVEIYNAAQSVKKYITSMPDILLLADNIGPDKISDLTTNIIYEELLEFTNYIIDKYKLDIDRSIKKKWIIDVENETWIKKELVVPIIDGKEILFLPEKIVTTSQIFAYRNVYKELVWPFYKFNPSIHGLIKILKDGREKSDCRRLKKKYPMTRATVEAFVKVYPEKYKLYKENIQKQYWRH